MRKYLKELGLEFKDSDLDDLIVRLAGAQKQRIFNKRARTRKVTRSTALVVLSELLPEIAREMQEAKFDWKGFRNEIGLGAKIVPEQAGDVDLHREFQAALARFRSNYSNQRELTYRDLAGVILEHAKEAPESGELYKRLEHFGLDYSLLPAALIGAKKAVEERSKPAADSARCPAWICQYVPGSRLALWTEEAHSGSDVKWWTEKKAPPSGMKPGDPVIYWRAINPKQKRDRGGIVGTGEIVSAEFETSSDGRSLLPTKVHEIYEESVIPRDKVIEFAGIDRTVWRGSLLELPSDQAVRVHELLEKMGRKGICREPADDRLGQVRAQRDAPELDHDTLGRAPLALSFAWTLHEIWCTEQGLEPYPKRESNEDTAGFVAHIDSPWGGGKTTFANLVMRVLNPDLDGHVPEFLKRYYPDRNEDMSGLFISAAHEKGKLKSESGKYLWSEEARRPWIVVPFNAWLHQHVKPPWWCFYQRVRKECFHAIKREGIPVVEQREDGSYRTQREDRRSRFMGWAKLWAKELLWRLTNGRVMFQLAVFAVSFIVGYLLWIVGGIDVVKEKTILSTSTGVGLVVAFLTGAGSFITAATTVVADALAPGRNILGEQVTLGSGDPLIRFRRHFARMISDLGRPVLIVVDDLDRCPPEFINELTRGLQTILLSPRVVYLILGDRKWIEKAFEVQHETMNSIDVGPEHTFGGRFVEKAIQLSFVLPAMAGHQKEYVRDVLLDRRDIPGGTSQITAVSQTAAEAEPEDGLPAEIGAEARAGIRDNLAQTESAEALDSSGSRMEQDLPDGGNRETGESYRRAVREEIILRRGAQKGEVQEAIRHHLQPLAAYLPSNPRHIKRIINAISMYQDSILLTEHRLTEAGFGKEQWRKLVVGVVLMMGYPKSWSILSAKPILADYVINGELPEAERTENELIPEGELEEDLQEQLALLRANDAVADLLSRTEFRQTPGGETVTTLIDSESVQWLNQVIPING